MSGVRYLLDTNVILGMLKSTPEALAMVGKAGLMVLIAAKALFHGLELLTLNAGLQAVVRSGA